MELNRRQFLQAGIFGVTAAALASTVAAEHPPRPQLQLTTQEGFDAAVIAPYRGDHSGVYQHIEAHIDEHLEHIRRWLRQPSVSAQSQGIEQMATLLRDDLRALGFRETELVPTSGHPGVWGYYDAGAPKTLLVYMMYDVQPVEPADWRVPPFEAQLVEHETGTVVMARGATNQKGPERAFLNAVASLLATEGRLPVNLMIAAEGEEELGSPHFPEIVDRYGERMRTAVGALFPVPSQNLTGDTRLNLGFKGIVYFELEAMGGPQGGPTKAEIHGSFKAIVDSPVWRLIQALATLVSADGNTVTVPGYYEAVRPPTDEEQRLVNGILARWEEETLKRQLAVERWSRGMVRQEALWHLLFETTLNIDGLWAGYTGEGVKTILPHKATAKVDSRLVPNQQPDDALALIRRHLDTQGFQDITIRKLSGYPPAQASVATPLVQSVIAVFNKYGLTPEVWPRLPGSAPFYQFTERLGLPIVSAGLGHGWNMHAPNEYMVIRAKPGSKIAGLAEMEKAYVDLLYAVALQGDSATSGT
jgi:Acetylornithine deacetylase/Succinyl-diaminopimelate desuccinylase and related deacylases